MGFWFLGIFGSLWVLVVLFAFGLWAGFLYLTCDLHCVGLCLDCFWVLVGVEFVCCVLTAGFICFCDLVRGRMST